MLQLESLFADMSAAYSSIKPSLLLPSRSFIDISHVADNKKPVADVQQGEHQYVTGQISGLDSFDGSTDGLRWEIRTPNGGGLDGTGTLRTGRVYF